MPVRSDVYLSESNVYLPESAAAKQKRPGGAFA